MLYQQGDRRMFVKFFKVSGRGSNPFLQFYWTVDDRALMHEIKYLPMKRILMANFYHYEIACNKSFLHVPADYVVESNNRYRIDMVSEYKRMMFRNLLITNDN